MAATTSRLILNRGGVGSPLFRRETQASNAVNAAAMVNNPHLARLEVPQDPTEQNLHFNLQQAVLELREDLRPLNTRKQQDPKVLEYFQYCDLVYPNDPYKYVLSKEKIYNFMWYQCFREAKPRGGGHQAREARRNGEYFDLETYRTVTDKFRRSEAGVSFDTLPEPEKPTGPATFTAYKAVFRKIYKVQVARGFLNNTHWEQLWQMCFDELFSFMKERVPLTKKKSYAEKVDGEFAPFAIVEHFTSIEELMWQDSHAVGHRSVSRGLRHRYCILHLTSGVLRCESLHRAEFSDFQGISVPKLDTDIHTPYLMINQIPIGKTTHGRTQYGRATRHRNVNHCCVGAFAMYVMYRFFCTNEFADLSVDDWQDNSKWFKVKLLSDVCSNDHTAEMKNDTFSTQIESVLRHLHLPSNKKVHLGRNLGARTLELLEEERPEILNMGQWSSGGNRAFDAYSMKLPMKPIRKLAGYHGSNKMYFNTRTTVIPDDNLLLMTPMGKWCYSAYSSPLESGADCQTALCTLQFFCEINKIFLQDAAAMAVLHPDTRATHPMFEQMPVLASEEFEEFKDKMRVALHNEQCPLDANLEKVLPGIHQWHQANDTAMRIMDGKVEALSTTVMQGFEDLAWYQEKQQQESDKRLAASFLSVAKSLLSREASGDSTGTGLSQLEETNGDMPPLEHFFPNRAPGSPGDIDTTIALHTSPQAVVTPTAMNDSVHRSFRMVPKHACLQNLYDEWVGAGVFADEYGGIEGRDKQFKKKWRPHLDAMHHSRTKSVVTGVRNFAKQKGVPIDEACALLDNKFKTCKQSVSNFKTYLQNEGLIAKRKPRGRKQSR